MMRVLLALLFLLAVPTAAAAALRTLAFPVRGEQLALAVYEPTGTPRGTVIMASGDVGWVGLAVSMSEFLATRGYVVVGVNTRQYLSKFTDGPLHLEVTHTPLDYDALRVLLASKQLLHDPVVVSGVSEGAAIAVLAASDRLNHRWISGVVTMGTPIVAELAWHWTNFTTWITKKDADEPSFAPADFIGRIAPLPLVMIQSTRDEYVSEEHYRRLDAAAQHPKKLVLIDAKNHRFTDRQDDVRREMLSAIDWIAAAVRTGR